MHQVHIKVMKQFFIKIGNWRSVLGWIKPTKPRPWRTSPGRIIFVQKENHQNCALAIGFTDSELEKYIFENKSPVGHWVLVKESKNNEKRRKNTDVRFTTDNVTVGTGSTERYLNVSGCGYEHTDDQCFAGGPFDRVDSVNADDNLLRLVTFRTFKSVQRLSLRRNHLKSVDP